MRLHLPQALGDGRRFVGLGLVWMAVATSGCGPTTPLEKAGIKIEPGSDWTTLSRDKVMAPGDIVAAWAGPSDSRLIVYTALPIPKPDSDWYAQESVTRLTGLPGITQAKGSSQIISGSTAARVDVLGAGDGSSLAATGMGQPTSRENKPIVPTRQVTVTFFMPAQTLAVVCNFPESAEPQLAPVVHKVLTSIALDAPASASRSY